MPANPTPIRGSTQEHLPIEDIRDDLVILKDGSCCLLLQASAINFELLSEKEQEAMIFAYGALLNSLSFPIQILIRSKRKDVSVYLKLLSEQERKLEKPILKKQLVKYKKFVEETVKTNEVLDKKFYVVIPFSALELGAVKTVGAAITGKKGLPFPRKYIIEKAKTSLTPRKDHLIKQFNRLGIKTRQLITKELINLFYQIYNPGKKQIIEAAEEATTPMVEAKMK